MKYWVVSPNLGDPGETNLDAWMQLIQRRKIAVMSWDEDHQLGRMFQDKVTRGDMILVAAGSNANKQLCIVGIVAGDTETDLGEKAPTVYSTFRKLEPTIVLDRNPTSYKINFNGTAYGDSQQIPAIYQLYPARNEADLKVVRKMLELLKVDSTAFAEDESGDELTGLIEELKKTYMDAGDGEYHQKLLLKGREDGKKNYEKVLQMQQDGKDITDAVLYGLLPHQNTLYNREQGHWIHVAPSITRDVKEWFEGAGWVKSGDWPDVAKRLFDFLKSAAEHPENFRKLCESFDSNFAYKGFQVGMLSPILNVLSPEHYLVVNNKPVAVINWLTGAGFKCRIKEMPDIVQAIRQWVDENQALLEPLALQGLSVYDTFDIFCHWLKAVKKYPLKGTAKADTSFERFGRGSAERAGEVFRKIFPDARNREAAEQLLTECILKAHKGNSNNWEITLLPNSIRFNVGFAKILHLDYKELRIFLLGSAFKPELREKYADIINFSDEHFKSLDEDVGKCVIAPAKLADIVDDLKYAVFQFIDTNSRQSKSSVWAGCHSPGVLAYMRQVSGKEIPSPDYEEEILQRTIEEDDDEAEVDAIDVLNEPESFNVAEEAAEGTIQYWWLNANPKIWDIIAPPIGTRQTYTAHNKRGNKRRIYQYFKQVKPGDLLLGYVASPIRQIAALCEATKSLHETDEGEVFEFKKIEQFAEPISLKQLQSLPELEKCEPLINNQGSLFRLRKEEYEVIRTIIDEANEEPVAKRHENQEFTLDQCAEATGFSIATLSSWLVAIERKGQAVFYGPPGTGKTFVAEHIARHLVGGTDGFVELLQFHPAYAYEEFMQGIRPDTDENGSLVFDLQPGRFLSFCARACQPNGQRRFFAKPNGYCTIPFR